MTSNIEKFLSYEGEDLSEGFNWDPNQLGLPIRHQILNFFLFELSRSESKDLDKVSWLVSVKHMLIINKDQKVHR